MRQPITSTLNTESPRVSGKPGAIHADEVRNERVSRLEAIAKQVNSKTFKRKPQTIYIQIMSVPD